MHITTYKAITALSQKAREIMTPLVEVDEAVPCYETLEPHWYTDGKCGERYAISFFIDGTYSPTFELVKGENAEWTVDEESAANDFIAELTQLRNKFLNAAIEDKCNAEHKVEVLKWN